MREAEKEEAMEPSCSQTLQNTTKPKVMSFFTLQRLKGTQPARVLAVQLAHLEEESAKKEDGTESEEPNGIVGVTEEFIVCLTRAVKDAQQEKKCCYHCSSLEHFIHECLLVKASRMDSHLNWKEGDDAKECSPGPLKEKQPCQGCPKMGCPRHRVS